MSYGRKLWGTRNLPGEFSIYKTRIWVLEVLWEMNVEGPPQPNLLPLISVKANLFIFYPAMIPCATIAIVHLVIPLRNNWLKASSFLWLTLPLTIQSTKLDSLCCYSHEFLCTWACLSHTWIYKLYKGFGVDAAPATVIKIALFKVLSWYMNHTLHIQCLVHPIASVLYGKYDKVRCNNEMPSGRGLP